MYNPETNRVVISSDIKWAEWKNTNPEETMEMWHYLNENDLLPGV